ncbi:MAG: VWA domain-containing protein [Deltaproteobacteria bacterium]|nr:MAG: VWA domain-containing protein [Deltaproteobacteria bacterium]
MELPGLSMAQVLTTPAVAGGAVVVLYLLKLRRRTVTVPFVKLWEQILAEKQTTRLFSQLKRLLSLLVALAIVAGLAFALGDPRYEGATASGRTLVALIDSSASMQATDTESGGRMAAARERVNGLIEGLGPADRLLIAQMDATTTPVSPLSSDPRVLRDALAGVRAEDVAADLGAGLRFALDVLRGQPDPEVVVISDGRIDAPRAIADRITARGVRLSYAVVGEASRNVAITAFSVRRYPLDKSQTEVLVELYNPTDEDEAIELTLLGDGAPLDVQTVTAAAGERTRRFFRNISGADQTLEARISLADGTQDALPVDDRAYARLPERRRARVLAVTPGNLYVSAALLLDEYLDVTEISPAQYAGTDVAGRFDVVVFDSFVPTTPPDAHAIYLYPLVEEGRTEPFAVTGLNPSPFFDRLERHHPLLAFTALRDVNVSESLAIELQEGDRVVAGDDRTPLVVTGSRNGHRMVALTFDLRKSDLPLRVAWPLLLLNSIDYFVAEDAAYVSSYRTGETWHVPVPAGQTSATIVDPDGVERQVPVVEGRAVYAGTRAGFYSVQTGEHEERFAANLGPGEEARIEPVAQLDVEGLIAEEPSVGRAGVRRELWIYLVFFALAILVVEWFTYHRRWTV